MRKKTRILMILFTFCLSACGANYEKLIVGNWEASVMPALGSYEINVTFTEDNIVICRDDILAEEPVVGEYRIVDDEKLIVSVECYLGWFSSYVIEELDNDMLVLSVFGTPGFNFHRVD
jgi:hypothetical protein